MKQSLRENKSGWASKFVEAGGIPALTQYMQNILQKPKYIFLDMTYKKISLTLYLL